MRVQEEIKDRCHVLRQTIFAEYIAESSRRSVCAEGNRKHSSSYDPGGGQRGESVSKYGRISEGLIFLVSTPIEWGNISYVSICRNQIM